jgi:DNA modification methylase
MSVRILVGDCRTTLATLPDQSVQCCVTSPPYFGLRDYGHAGQIGLEETPDAFVAELVAVFREVRRVLRDDGTLWLNLGDSYARGFGGGSPGAKSATNAGSFADRESRPLPDGLKGKDLVGIPWMVAFALRADGWYLRSDIIWHKPNPMPESVTDRPTKSHEYLFLLAKSERYYYDADAIAEPAIHAGAVVTNDAGKNSEMGEYGQTRGGFLREGGVTVKDTRNKRSVWTVPTSPFKGAHFATFPPALIEPCILAWCPKDGTVLDPFGGAGTTGLVSDRLGRDAILCELNAEYAAMAEARIRDESPLFANVEAS